MSNRSAQAVFDREQAEFAQFHTTFEVQQGEIRGRQNKLQALRHQQRLAQDQLAQAEGKRNQLLEREREQVVQVVNEGEIAQAEMVVSQFGSQISKAENQLKLLRQQRDVEQGGSARGCDERLKSYVAG